MKAMWRYKRSSPANMVGAIGYTLLLASLMLTIVVLFVWFLANTTMSAGLISQPEPSDSSTYGTTSDEPNLIAQVFAYGLTGLVILVSIFVLITLPYWLGRWTSRIMKRLLLRLKIPLRSLNLFWSKTIFGAIAIIGSGAACLAMVGGPLQDVGFTAFFAIVMATLSILCFGLQHYMAYSSKVNVDVLW